MTQTLHYARPRSRLKPAILLISRWCWIVFAIAMLVPAWPYIAPWFQSPESVQRGDGEQFWKGVAGVWQRQIFLVDRSDGSIIYGWYGCGRSGVVLFRITEQEMIASRFAAANDAALFIIVPPTTAQAYGYLKAVTGQDFGHDQQRWTDWVSAHGEAKNGIDAYHSAMDEWSRDARNRGLCDPWQIEAAYRDYYVLAVQERGQFTWKVGVAIASYLTALLVMLCLHRILLRHCRRWLAL